MKKALKLFTALSRNKLSACYTFLIVALVFSSLPAFSFEIKVNGKSVDLFKKSGEDKEKSAKSNNTSSKPGALKEDASSQSGPERVFGKGPVGPDVIGLKIGMTPNDARNNIKTKGLKIRKNGEEFFGLLGISSDGNTMWLPNVKYLKKISALKEVKEGHQEEILRIYFSPSESGNERIMGVHRASKLGEGNRPTIDAFENTIFEKYGKPIHAKKKAGTYGNQRHYFWIYDSNGNAKTEDFAPSLYQLCVKEGVLHEDALNDIYSEKLLNSLQEFSNKFPTACGNISLQIILGMEGNIVTNHTTSLQGYDEWLGSSLSAKKFANEAAEKNYREKIKKGESIKPDI